MSITSKITDSENADRPKVFSVDEEVKDAYFEYFEAELGPSDALRFYENKFLIKGDIQEMCNANQNPTKNQVSHLYNLWKKSNPATVDPFQKLNEKIPFYESKGITIKLLGGARESWAVLIVTNVMKRTHSLDISKDIVYIDSNCISRASTATLTILSVPTKVGLLPLAILIHLFQSTDSYIAAFELLRNSFPHCFGGRDSPRVFLTEDFKAVKTALLIVWSESEQLLSHFHVAQAELQWINGHWSVAVDDEKHFMKSFQTVMSATTENELEEAEEYLLQNCHNDIFVKRFKKFYERKEEWVSLYRQDLIKKQKDMSNYIEATLRISKEIVLCRTKTFHIVTLCELCVSIWEDYLTTELTNLACSEENYVHNVYNSLYKRILPVDENDVIELCDGIYEMKNGEDSFIIEANIGVCSCFAGTFGVFCKHQCTLMNLNKIKFPNMSPLTQKDKHNLAKLALGSKCPPFKFFSVSSIKMEEDNSLEDILETSNELQEASKDKAKPASKKLKDELIHELDRIGNLFNEENLSKKDAVRILSALQKIKSIKQFAKLVCRRDKLKRRNVLPSTIIKKKKDFAKPIVTISSVFPLLNDMLPRNLDENLRAHHLNIKPLGTRF